MWTRTFWRRTAERAVKSAAQGWILAIGTDQFGWVSLDWAKIAAVGGILALLSVLTSIVSAPIGDGEDPSVVP